MLSFVVPAHNEARGLAATLASLHDAARESGAAYEIVVADDASTDGTGAIAAAAGARVLRVEHRHIAATRNAGARAAKGDRLVFVDGDTVIDTRTLQAAIRALDAGAVGGGATVRLQGPLRWHQQATITVAAWLFRMVRIAPGAFIFCSRSAFDAVGGFDEAYFAAEDVAISRALAKVGRFVMLREPVWTSARKLHTFGAREPLRLMLRFMLRGRKVLHSREALELWYGPRREKD